MIEESFYKNKDRYNARRIHLILDRQGVKVKRKRVLKFMSAHSLIMKGMHKTYRKITKRNFCKKRKISLIIYLLRILAIKFGLRILFVSEQSLLFF